MGEAQHPGDSGGTRHSLQVQRSHEAICEGSDDREDRGTAFHPRGDATLLSNEESRGAASIGF
jgi:hypothetical protein